MAIKFLNTVAVDTDVLYVDASSNRVGIGTTSPGTKLHVESADETVATFERNAGSGFTAINIKDGVGTTGNSAIRFSDTTGSPGEINYEHADNSLRINTNSSERMRITSAGNVGIGTTSPGAKLHLFNAGYPQMALQSNGGTWQVGVSTGNDLAFRRGTSGSNYPLWLDSSDNVGIGTTSPSKKLEVAGEIKGTNLFAETYRSARTDGDIYIQAATATDFVSIGTQISPNLMRIDGGGNVGIGTTSPSHKLDVDGGAQFNTKTGAEPFYITRLGSTDQALSIKVMDDNVRFESIQDEAADSYGGFDFRMDGGVTEPNFVIRKNAGDPILHVDGAGKVGINSTNPSSTLQVGDGTADSSFRTYYNDSTYTEVRGYGVNFNRQYSYLRPTSDNDKYLFIGSQSNTWNYLYLNSNTITFSDNTSEVMRINPGGNVGIGTTSPSYKLDVSGGARAGGVITYSKFAGSLDTTGYAVAGLTTGSNGDSAGFTFTCFGHTGSYQKIVYSCHNAGGTWNTNKVIDEGTNDFDVEASANGTTITFTFKSTSGTKSYTPRVTVEATGSAINNTYA